LVVFIRPKKAEKNIPTTTGGVEEYNTNDLPPYGDEQDDFDWSQKGMLHATLSTDCPCPN
jgi:hypothetical protein